MKGWGTSHAACFLAVYMGNPASQLWFMGFGSVALPSNKLLLACELLGGQLLYRIMSTPHGVKAEGEACNAQV